MQQIVRKTSQKSVSRDKTSVKYSYISSALSTRKLQSLRGELPPCLWLTSPEIFKRVRTKQMQWRVHPYFQFEARLLQDASASEHPVFLLKEPRYSEKYMQKKTILIPRCIISAYIWRPRPTKQCCLSPVGEGQGQRNGCSTTGTTITSIISQHWH